MAKDNNIASQLQDLLVTQNFEPSMLGATGQPVNNPDDAKIFSFDYRSESGKNYGTMVIVLGAENDLQIMYGDNLGRAMDDAQDREGFFAFQHHLRDFAHRRRWTVTPTDISRLKHVQSGLAAIKEGLFEGYYGTRQISYQGQPTEARLMIKHSRRLSETDARHRHVDSLFIETVEGERFRLPFTNLMAGRAMLEHVRQGGRPYDIRGNHITEMVSELKLLSRFRRAAHNRVTEGVTQDLVEQVNQYYSQVRQNLQHMGTARGYGAYFETWHPASVQPQEALVEDLKALFVEQRIDDRIEAALPLLARIQQGSAMKEIEIFENWIANLGEGTWALPKTDEDQQRLRELVSQPLTAGPDGTDATQQLYDIVGDDQLYDIIGDIAQQDPDANIWDSDTVWQRMSELGLGSLRPGQGREQADQPVSEGTCNMTAKGEYCPKHGIMECGSHMESMGGTVAGAVAPMEEGVDEEDPLELSSDYALYIADAGRKMMTQLTNLAKKIQTDSAAAQNAKSWKLGDYMLQHYEIDDLGAINQVFEEYGIGGLYDNNLYELLSNWSSQGAEYVNTWKQYSSDVIQNSTRRPPGAQPVHEQGMAEDAVADFLARGGQIQRGKFHKPRKSEKTDYGSRHIGGVRDAVAGKAGKTLGRAAATNFMGGGKPVVGEGMQADYKQQVFDQILDGEVDAYDVMSRPQGGAQEYVAMVLQDMYDDVARDHRLHPDDDFEQILDIVVDRIEKDYGHSSDRGMSEDSTDPMDHRGAVTDSFYESELSRLKKLAFVKRT